VSLRASKVSRYDSLVSLHYSMVSLYDSMISVMFTKSLDQSIEGFYFLKIAAGTYVPFRDGQNVPGKKKFSFVPLRKK
jgi:hypothetical protein